MRGSTLCPCVFRNALPQFRSPSTFRLFPPKVVRAEIFRPARPVSGKPPSKARGTQVSFFRPRRPKSRRLGTQRVRFSHLAAGGNIAAEITFLALTQSCAIAAEVSTKFDHPQDVRKKKKKRKEKRDSVGERKSNVRLPRNVRCNLAHDSPCAVRSCVEFCCNFRDNICPVQEPRASRKERSSTFGGSIPLVTYSRFTNLPRVRTLRPRDLPVPEEIGLRIGGWKRKCRARQPRRSGRTARDDVMIIVD